MYDTPERTSPDANSSAVPPIARFAWSVLAYNLAVIMWGAYVRASGSGAGCGSHWPLCNGVVVPRAPRFETIIEFAHRGTSGIDAILVVVLVWWTFRHRSPGDPARRAAVASALLMVLEALLGAGLVLFGWVDKNASWGRVGFLALHLVSTFMLLAALTLTAWRLSGAPGTKWRGQGADGALVWSMFGLLLFVATSGAITSLGDTLFPAASLGEGVRNDFLPTAHFLERLRVIHPMIAIFTALAVVRGALLISHRRPAPVTRKLAVALCVLVVSQLAVGALNLAFAAPVSFQLIHLFVADLVWICMVLLAAAALARGSNLKELD